MSDQCALDSGGQLKDASDIDFYDSESDEKALPRAPPDDAPRRSSRKRLTDKLTESLAAENADEDGNPLMKRAPRASAARVERVKIVPETQSEEEDENFEMPALQDVSDSEDDNSDSENEGVGNDEVQQLADLLSSKTVLAHGGARSSKPQTRRKPSAGKRKRSEESAPALPAKKAPRVAVEEVEDEDDPPKSTYKNPVYLFYDKVTKNAEGSTGKPGYKHYKCRHGNGRIITVTKAMKQNLSGLTTHLKNDFPVMDEPPTQQEIDLARGDVPIDSDAAKAYLGKVETATANIIKSLENQAKKARVRVQFADHSPDSQWTTASTF
ncbi:hypothetical protein B0H13DRAFT_2385778 [Mycena leptocephala]|nr:hypothetical protein B0H13DRAFT_2385778 [Mycena leptocephala]